MASPLRDLNINTPVAIRIPPVPRQRLELNTRVSLVSKKP
jgi:hypothetical protein